MVINTETIESEITGIERHILICTDKNSFLNKRNETQRYGKLVSPWCLLLDRQPTMNVIMNKELVKYIHDARGRFVRVHCNAGPSIIMT